MNKKIRLTAAILSLAGVLSAANVYAKKADIDTWLSYSSGSSEVINKDGGIHLNVETEANESGIARLEYEIENTAETMYFSVVFSVDAMDASGFYPDRTIYLASDTDDLSVVKNSSVIACISANDLLGGKNYAETGITVSNNEEHLLCAEVNVKDGIARLWLDGAECGSVEIDASESLIESGVSLVFENTYQKNKKNARSSGFAIFDVCDSVAVEPELKVTLAEDKMSAFVNIGAVANEAEIEIEGCEYTYEFVGGGFNVSFNEALGEEEYPLLVTVKALDGNEYTKSCILNEKVYTFSLPEKATYTKEELKEYGVTADSSINKVSYWVDNEYQGSYASPFKLDLSKLSKGTHFVKAAALTEKGKLLTDKKELLIINKNKDTSPYYDFDNLEAGMIEVLSSNRLSGANDMYSQFNGADGMTNSIEAVGDHEKALVFGSNGEKDGKPFMAICRSIAEGIVVFETDLYFFDANVATGLTVRGANAAGATAFLENIRFSGAGDKISVDAYDGAASYSVKKLDTNKWYNLSYEFDLKNQKYSLGVDGEEIVTDYSFNLELTQVNNMIRFGTTQKAGTVSKMAIDNISMSVVRESMSIIESTVEKGAKNLTIYLAGKISELAGEIVIKDNARVVKTASCKMLGDKIAIELEKELLKSGRYDIAVKEKQSGEVINGYFTVKNDVSDLEDISIYASEGKCSVVFTQNEMPENEGLIFVVNRYSEGKLVETRFTDECDDVVTISDIEYEDKDTVKAFALIKGQSGVVPFADSMVQQVLFK